MRRHGGRLFRVIRGVLPDDAEAEDVCKDAWLRAFARLASLPRGAAFSTWLDRIGLRCALERAPRLHAHASLDELDRLPIPPVLDDSAPSTVDAVEQAIGRLPPAQRVVVLLRDVEQLGIGEIAEVLGVTKENVCVRLHRARERLRDQLGEVDELGHVFALDDVRCDRLVGAVVRRIHSLQLSA